MPGTDNYYVDKDGKLIYKPTGQAGTLSASEDAKMRAALAEEARTGISNKNNGGGEGGMGMPLTSTTTTDLPEWLKPYAQDFLKAYAGLALPGGRPAVMPEDMNQTLAGMTDQQKAALQNIYNTSEHGAANLAAKGASSLYDTFSGKYLDPNQNPYISQAYKDTLSGKYLDPTTNPWLQKTYEAASRAVTADYRNAVAPSRMVQAQQAGQFGGSAYDQSRIMDEYGMGRTLDELATSIYGQNYQAERGRQVDVAQDYMGQYGAERTRMLQALGYAPEMTKNLYAPAYAQLGAGSFEQEQQQMQNDMDWQNATRRNEYPFTLLSGFGSALGQAGGGTGTATSTQFLPNFSNGGGPSSASLAAYGLTPQILQILGGFLNPPGGNNSASNMSLPRQ